MTKTITLRQANQAFAPCVREVEPGEDYLITRNGKPVAGLVPAARDRPAPAWPLAGRSAPPLSTGTRCMSADAAPDGARFTLDTNILVYCVDSTAGPKREVARQVVEAAVGRDCRLTLQAISEFCVAAARKDMMPRSEAAAQASDWLDPASPPRQVRSGRPWQARPGAGPLTGMRFCCQPRPRAVAGRC